MRGVSREEPVKMAARKDEGPVQDLGANGPDPALGEGVGLRSTEGRGDHPGIVGSEHGVEGARELGVAIADEEPNSGGKLTGHVDVAKLAGWCSRRRGCGSRSSRGPDGS